MLQRFNAGVAMIALSLDNVLFLLLIAVAALFQLLSKTISKSRKNELDETPTSPPTQRPPPVLPNPKESDADRIRKFLEALGQPASSTPPPPVVPRTNVPSRPLAPVQPPPVFPRTWGRSRELPRKPDLTPKESPPSEQPSRFREIAPPTIPVSVAQAFEVHEGASAVELEQPAIVKAPVGADTAAARAIAKEPDFKTEIITLLGSKSRLREAIILREIFGPPRSLRELEL